MDKVLSNDGLLATKTRVFATNSIHALKFSDSIVMLQNGCITERGTYNDLIASSSQSQLKQLIEEFGRQHSDINESTEVSDASSLSKISSPDSESDPDTSFPQDDNDQGLMTSEQGWVIKSKMTKRRSFRQASMESLKETFRARKPKPKADRILQSTSSTPLTSSGSASPRTESSQSTVLEPSQIELGTAKPKRTEKTEEKAMQGRVKFTVYAKYIQACGVVAVIFTVSVVIISSADGVATKFWLKHWSEHNSKAGGNTDAFTICRYILLSALFLRFWESPERLLLKYFVV